jgi:flagellar basal-body rod modification protein FlgD
VTAPITGNAGGAAATETSVLAGKATLGKDDFLRILVTQLRNQDPLNPMEGTEFATQLAQFSSVEQLIQMGEAMTASTAATTELKLTAQTTLGASMVGRDVILNGAKVTVTEGEPTRVAFDLDGAADDVTVRILDAKGKALVTEDLGAAGTGRRIVTLDTGDLAEGTYTYEVVATNAAKQAVTATPFTLGRVDGMAFNGGTIALRINGTLVPMLDVVEVLAVAGPAASVPTSQEQTTP